MTKAKKLIEVAMPIREVSMESKRDKNLNHGHISSLHLWWARRPLPVCRAVVFASLVPDPNDSACPPVFLSAVNLLLADNVYKPYDDIPFTAIEDKMEDNPRNRLLCFVGRFSDKMVLAEKLNQKKVSPSVMLADHSLVKWESRNNDKVLTIARKLIYVAHNADKGADAGAMMVEYEQGFAKVLAAEKALYEIEDRHLAGKEVQQLEANLATAIEAFLDRMPKVFDPFAGGGAIPLEAARLGCRSFGNDINPVAHIIQRASLEFPQRFGKPIIFSRKEYERIYGTDAWDLRYREKKTFGDKTLVDNRLSHDVAHYANVLLSRTHKKVGHLYPKGPGGKEVIAYYWVRTGNCTNPSCGAEVPLLKSFDLVKKKNKKVSLKPHFDEGKISFSIENKASIEKGWVRDRKNLYCPICKNVTSNSELKAQFNNGNSGLKLLVVIEKLEKGKGYRPPTDQELNQKTPHSTLKLEERMPVKNTKQFDLCPWGFETYESLFSNRQLKTLETFVSELNHLKSDWTDGRKELDSYGKALATYLAVWIDRIAVVNTTFGIWHTGAEKLERTMGRQAIAMVFDYPESNPFCSVTASASNQLVWIVKYLNSESRHFIPTICQNSSSGEKEQFPSKYLTAVITDPPYYDAIAYADLSDFFYVWLKRTLFDVFPAVFGTPQTPKTEECTAMKHHHKGSKEAAKTHFEEKLLQIFEAIEIQTSDVVSIMFAHQTVEAWTTLCNSILGSSMNINASWATDTELVSGLKTNKAFLSSSVTVACRPVVKSRYADFGDVKEEIKEIIVKQVKELYALGFRGADLLTACFGQAVSVFGRYKAVEKANGDEVTVAELLELARNTAFKSIINDIDTDDPTRFYIGWLNLVGFSEEDHDMVRKITQMGLNIDTSLLETHNILISEGSKQKLADGKQRLELNGKLGLLNGKGNYGMHIDQVHRLGQLWNLEDRPAILRYLKQVAPTPEDQLWRVLTALKELLPAKHADGETVSAILANQEALLRDAKDYQGAPAPQGELF